MDKAQKAGTKRLLIGMSETPNDNPMFEPFNLALHLK
jgi:hypothetical protein